MEVISEVEDRPKNFGLASLGLMPLIQYLLGHYLISVDDRRRRFQVVPFIVIKQIQLFADRAVRVR
jgi:hypothetical protein